MKKPLRLLLLLLCFHCLNAYGQTDTSQKTNTEMCDDIACAGHSIYNGRFEGTNPANCGNTDSCGGYFGICNICRWASYLTPSYTAPVMFETQCANPITEGSYTYSPIIPFNPGTGPLVFPHNDTFTNRRFAGLHGGYDAATGKWQYDVIAEYVAPADIFGLGSPYYLSFWARNVSNSWWNNVPNPIAFYTYSDSGSAVTPLTITSDSELSQTAYSNILSQVQYDSDDHYNPNGRYFMVPADTFWHHYVVSFVYDGKFHINAQQNFLAAVPSYLPYDSTGTTPAGSFRSMVLIDDIDFRTGITMPYITGPASVCSGSTATLVITDSGGGGNNEIFYHITDGSGTYHDTALVNIGDTIQVNLTVTGTVTITLDSLYDYYCYYPLNNTFTITPNTAPAVTIGGSDTICSGSSFNIPVSGTYTSGVTEVSYTEDPGGSMNTTLNSSYINSGIITVTGTSPGIRVYTLTGATTGACAGTASGSFTLTVLPKPYALITDTSFCQGADISLTGTPNTMVDYNINGGSTQSITLDGSGNGIITVASSGSFTYELLSCYYTSLTGCDSALDKTYYVTVNAAPYASIPTYDTTICDSTSVGSIHVTGTPGAIVNYTIDLFSSSHITLDGAGQGLISTSGLVSTSSFDNTCYTITLENVVNDTTGCFGTVSGEVQICVRPPLYAQILPNEATCNGEQFSDSLNITGNFFSSVSYTDPNGITDTVNLNMTGMGWPFMPSDVNTGTTPLTYNYTLDNIWYNIAPQCVTPLTGSITLTVYPTPSATITPTDTLTICSGTEPAITITGVGTEVKYTITTPSGSYAYASSLPVTVNPSVFVSTNPNAPTYYTVTIDTVFNPVCNTIGGQTLVVSVLPTPATSVAVFNSVVCANDAPEPYINFTGVPGTEAYYTFDGATDSILILSGGTAQLNITDTNTSATADIDTLILTGSGYSYSPYCFVSENDTVIITVKSLPTISFTTPGGLTTGCQELTITAVSNAATGSHYDWYHNGLLWQQGLSDSIQAIDSGEYTVLIFDSLTGCHNTDSILINIDNPYYVDLTGTTCGPFPFTLDPDITGGNTGATYTYSWASSPTDPTLCASCAMPAVSPTANTEYSVTITGPASTCAPATATAGIVVAPHAACACSYCQPPAGLGTTGYVTSDVDDGFYYIDSNVTISNPGGQVTFNGANVLVAHGVNIYIDKNTHVVMEGSHFFACPGDTWQGITLLSDSATASGRLQIGKSTLIEDAQVGLYISHPVTPAGFDPTMPAAGQDPSFDVLWCSNTIFNHDKVGIEIDNYGPTYTQYPIAIGSTVFSSRNVGLYGAGCGNSYPFVWQGTDSLLAAPSLTGCAAFTPLAKLINDTASPCHDGNYPAAGIELSLIGPHSTTLSAFYGLVVGDSTGNLPPAPNDVLFDHLHYGIYAVNSNLRSYSSTFMYLNGSARSVGIYDSVSNDRYRYTLGLPEGLDTNRFYDCGLGVYACNLYNINAHSTYMASEHVPSTALSGLTGFKVQSSRYARINISDNSLYNISNGIVVFSLSDTAARNGGISVNNNTIASTPDISCTPSSFRMVQGIAVENMNSDSAGAYMDTVDVSQNTLALLDGTGAPVGSAAWNGIYVSNYTMQHTKIDSNTVYIPSMPGDTAQQFGIEVANCIGNTIADNFVYGPGYASPAPPTIAYGGHVLAGIYSANNQTVNIGCNHSIDINTGFQFYGNINIGVHWCDNVMNDNAFGFVLDGLIGQQGNLSTPSDNEWDTSAGFSWTGANLQTLVISSDAANSTLYVRNATGFVPTNNNLFGTGFQYNAPGTLYGVAYSSPVTAADCLDYTSPDGKLTGGNDTTTVTDSIMEKATQQRLGYTGNIWRKNWQAQYAVWQSIAADSTLTDSSDVLQQFWSMAANSRFSYLAGIENALANGDTATAQNMLNTSVDYLANTDSDFVTGVKMADDTEADVVVNNYRIYYKLYLHFVKGIMSGADSLETLQMAQLCPMMNGAAVYKARALYNLIYSDMRIFDDYHCDDTTRLASRPAGSGLVNQNIVIMNGNDGQSYSLYPNPSSGNFTIQQSVPDENPVLAEISNSMGQRLYKAELHFESGQVQMAYQNLVPGVYTLTCADSKGRVFILKFVVLNK